MATTKPKSPASKGRGRKLAAEKAPAKAARTSKAKADKVKKPKASKATKAKVAATNEGIRTETVSDQPNPNGRPTGYKQEYATIARKMCNMGATDSDLAEAFGVTTSTIWRWSTANPEFCSALKVEKSEFDDRVVRSLAQRAVGYSYDAVKIFMPAGAESPVYAPYREHVPPDPGACKLWLTNRRRDEWADTAKHEVTGKDGSALMPENINSRDMARTILEILRDANAQQG